MDEHVEASFEIAKTDASRQLVFGYASVAVRKDGEQIRDAHQDLIDPEDLEEAAYLHVAKFGETGEMHEGESKGVLVESVVFTPEKLEKMGLAPDALPLGWWVGYYLPDPDVFEKVRNGTYRMLSVQGRCVREEIE